MKTNTLSNGTQSTDRRRIGKAMTGLMLALLCLSGFMQPAPAATTIVVTSTADAGPDTPLPGTLREALINAMDGDTVDATGVTGTITLVTGALTTGELRVPTNMTIVGPGPANLTVDGDQVGRVFHLHRGLTVTISGLTISNGLAAGHFPGDRGGGIYNDRSNLTVSNCTISGNTADDGGGGVYNDGSDSGSATLTVIASTISGNTAISGGDGTGTGISGGGGICNDGTGGNATLTVANSTLSDNSGQFGGGILTDGSLSGTVDLTMINSTLSRNSADVGGGGIFNFNSTNSGSATLTVIASTLSGNTADIRGGGINNAEGGAATVANCTLSGNSAPFAGGIENSVGTLTVANCTFSGNSADDGGGIFNLAGALEIGSTILRAGAPGVNITNLFGTVTSHGFNLSSDDGGGFLTATGDQINTDPLLGPLADNGGPTHTHLLLTGSPAIDGGTSDTLTPFGITTDQRGLPRTFDDPGTTNAPFGDGTDIGAVELQQSELPNNSPVAKCKNVSVLAGAGGTANASIDDGSFDPDGDAITLVQTPPGPYPIGNTTVTLKVTDSHGLSNSCSSVVSVVGVANLAISKAVVSGKAEPGQLLIYTITVNNTGPNAASGVVVNDAVPQGTTFSSASPAPASAPPVGAAGTVVWNVGNLNSGASATFTLKVKVSVKGNTLIVNTATVTSSSSDPNLANNTATITSKRKAK